jgi:hypothetical protein
MKLGLSIGYSGAELKLPVEKILRAESLGFDSVRTAEAYGSDAITPLAYLAASPSGSASAPASCSSRRGRHNGHTPARRCRTPGASGPPSSKRADWRSSLPYRPDLRPAVPSKPWARACAVHRRPLARATGRAGPTRHGKSASSFRAAASSPPSA